MIVIAGGHGLRYNNAMKIYNTLTKSVQTLQPLHEQKISYYTCGPTVYDDTHIGHMRTFVGNDIIRRVLTHARYNVEHVMNITDVGHLTSDEDAGEDKMEKGAKKSGKTVYEVAAYYTDRFFQTMDALNVLRPKIVCKATEHIPQMIALIQKLQEKGFAYETDEALYFDVSKFPSYGALSGQKIEDKLKGVREEVYQDAQKRNAADFALWFKRKGRFADHSMHWESPWGDGFPGWHIECSAMSMHYLGNTIEIHTGGIDHIPVHHENEIAQSEAATGEQFVRYWMHHHHLHVDGEKMSKSKNNFYTLEHVKAEGINPLSLRLLFMQTHYRQPMNFTWAAARGANEAYRKLLEMLFALRKQNSRTMLSEDKLSMIDHYQLKFNLAIENDLQMSQALAVMWDMLKSNITSEDKLDLLYSFDEVLGLGLKEAQEEEVPAEIKTLAEMRKQFRENKKFDEADAVRKELESKGYTIEDTGNEYRVKKM